MGAVLPAPGSGYQQDQQYSRSRNCCKINLHFYLYLDLDFRFHNRTSRPWRATDLKGLWSSRLRFGLIPGRSVRTNHRRFEPPLIAAFGNERPTGPKIGLSASEGSRRYELSQLEYPISDRVLPEFKALDQTITGSSQVKPFEKCGKVAVLAPLRVLSVLCVKLAT